MIPKKKKPKPSTRKQRLKFFLQWTPKHDFPPKLQLHTRASGRGRASCSDLQRGEMHHPDESSSAPTGNPKSPNDQPSHLKLGKVNPTPQVQTGRDWLPESPEGLSAPNLAFSFLRAEQGSLHGRAQIDTTMRGTSEPRICPPHCPEGGQRSASDPRPHLGCPREPQRTLAQLTHTSLFREGSALVMLHILHCN